MSVVVVVGFQLAGVEYSYECCCCCRVSTGGC